MSNIVAFSEEQFKALLAQIRTPSAGLGAPHGKPGRALGFGCGESDFGPLATGIYSMLAAGSPRLALAKARGVPLAPYIINVRAIFPDTSTTLVPDVGSDVKITQDTLIDSLIVRIQNESDTANQNQFQTLSDFFYGYQSGIEATLDVQGAPRYTVTGDKFVPLSVLGDPNNGVGHWPGGWVLTYQQQLFMSFQAKVLLPYAPLEVICSFRGWVPVTQAFVSMTNREAITLLQSEFGIQLDDSYIQRVVALWKMAKLSTEMIVGLSVLGAATVLGAAYLVTKTNAQAAAALLNSQTQVGGSGTVASSLTNGVNYTINATAPVGAPDATTLASQLTSLGWSNVTVTSFTAANSPYVATATWSGANGAAAPAGATVTVT